MTPTHADIAQGKMAHDADAPPQARIPRATYRLQFSAGFTFADAAALVPYLSGLGVSHCYSSPFLKARAGSPHGYDIVDHNALDPEIGGTASFAEFTQALQNHAMGQVLDFVPNHMGVGGDDNAWWLDVLENGRCSRYSAYFDIDWHPIKEQLRNKVLLPLLGDHYGAELESGRVRLNFDYQRGEFAVRYYHHRFPLDPRTYIDILEDAREEAGAIGGEARRRLAALVSGFADLPGHADSDPARCAVRANRIQVLKQELRTLANEDDALRAYIVRRLEAFNGEPGNPDSFDGLHRLLEAQPYRLAYWRVAADEINYRRFFDINDLAGLRMEDPAVFDATHRFVLGLVAEGKIDGLRIDHPDGLFDPAAYYQRLCEQLNKATGGDGTGAPRVYTVVEKILAPYERLPDGWPVHGTTGYEFANLVNGLFIDPRAERALTRIYARHSVRTTGIDELIYRCKRLTMRGQLSSELTVLANLLDSIAESNRATRDFTLNGLREALTEFIARFPVYRTYINARGPSEEDRRYIDWALARARKGSPAAEQTTYDFIHRLLVDEGAEKPPLTNRHRVLRFAMKLQQYTAPVTAKGVEDTALYIYNRFLALNEVGGDLGRFGVSVQAFHYANAERLERWPHAMVTTTTHDTKRSEDVRARIDVLSELAPEWNQRVGRWLRLNRRKRRIVDEEPAPTRNDEYALYQTLIGAWPLEDLDAGGLAPFRERIEAYMLKAIREAKLRTSWITPNAAYEEGVIEFVRALLGGLDRNPFIADFVPFQRRVAWFGMLNSLSQTLIKLTAPGVPDIYQGCELWNFALVDPDNRRPVDFGLRRRLLAEVAAVADGAAAQTAGARRLFDAPQDGRAKLYLTRQALQLRRARPQLFAAGSYVPLTVTGTRAEHLCAFARMHPAAGVVVACAPRLYVGLTSGETRLPLGVAAWEDTTLQLPPELAAHGYQDIFTGRSQSPSLHEQGGTLAASELFNDCPVVLLASTG